MGFGKGQISLANTMPLKGHFQKPPFRGFGGPRKIPNPKRDFSMALKYKCPKGISAPLQGFWVARSKSSYIFGSKPLKGAYYDLAGNVLQYNALRYIKAPLGVWGQEEPNPKETFNALKYNALRHFGPLQGVWGSRSKSSYIFGPKPLKGLTMIWQAMS